jgi:hypothetical protein
MYDLKKKSERYLRVNLLEPGPRLMKKEFTGRDLTKVEKHCLRGYNDTYAVANYLNEIVSVKHTTYLLINYS